MTADDLNAAESDAVVQTYVQAVALALDPA